MLMHFVLDNNIETEFVNIQLHLWYNCEIDINTVAYMASCCIWYYVTNSKKIKLRPTANRSNGKIITITLHCKYCDKPVHTGNEMIETYEMKFRHFF